MASSVPPSAVLMPSWLERGSAKGAIADHSHTDDDASEAAISGESGTAVETGEAGSYHDSFPSGFCESVDCKLLRIGTSSHGNLRPGQDSGDGRLTAGLESKKDVFTSRASLHFRMSCWNSSKSAR